MDEATKKRLHERNQRIIDMVIERAKRDFPEDIAIIGVTGSFAREDYHEKSDLDLIIINNTSRAWEIAHCFILDDVGFDIYCTPWETRIEDEANVANPHVSNLTDLKILYCAKPEYLERLEALKQRALDTLAKPIGPECLERAKKYINEAKQSYADTLLNEDIGAVRYAAGVVAYNLINTIFSMNNKCIQRGIMHYPEELTRCEHQPEGFMDKYMAIINAKTLDELRATAKCILGVTIELYEKMMDQYVPKPTPTYENLTGSYEEFWSNCRNKVLNSTKLGDKQYAFQAALGAQNYLDVIHGALGTKRFNLLKDFDADDLGRFKAAFLDAMDEYLEEYKRFDKPVTVYNNVDELYAYFMKDNKEDKEIKTEIPQEASDKGFDELYTRAKAVLNPWKLSESASSGGVGAALLTAGGNIYVGVCIDTSSSMGFCAEHAAAGAMITAGEHIVTKMVAVDWDGKVLPPCGRCREFISQLADENTNAEVLVKEDTVVKLKELLPFNWQE